MQRVRSIKSNREKLKKDYMNSCSKKEFRTLVDSIDLSDDYLMLYTSRLEDVVEEGKSCSKCEGLKECRNAVKGHVLTAVVQDEGLNFFYAPCPLKEKYDDANAWKKMIACYDLPQEIKKASFKEIYKDDKSRVPVIKYFKEFMNSYLKGEKPKGLYLHGSFGSGKTYLIAALFNELAKKGIASALVYYPELLRGLKASFGGNYEERFEYLKKVPLLLLDDIGAENTTAWSRDEVLGVILQYRMEEHLPTFFTSNLSIEELEQTLSVTSNGVDKIKARRIIERIKQLTKDLKLISINRRD